MSHQLTSPSPGVWSLAWPRWTLPQIALLVGTLALTVAALLTLDQAGRLLAAARSLIARPDLIALFLATYTLAFFLRAFAWRLLLPARAPGLFALWGLLQIALLANHLFPTKAGEAIRVALVARRGVPLANAAASTAAARLLDFAALCLIALSAGALAGVAADHLVIGLAFPLAGIACAGLLWLLLRHDSGWPARLPLTARVRAPVAALQAALRAIPPARLLIVAALVGPSWLLEAGALWCVAQAAGVPISPIVAIAATAGAIAFQAFQVTPGGIGLYEASLTGALALTGLDPATGLTLALATHGLKFAYSYLVGFACLIAEARTTSSSTRSLAQWPWWSRIAAVAASPLMMPVGVVVLLIALEVVAGQDVTGRWILLMVGVVVSLPLVILSECHHLPRPLLPVLAIPSIAFFLWFGVPAGAAGLFVLTSVAVVGFTRSGGSMRSDPAAWIAGLFWPFMTVQAVAAGAERPWEVGAFGLAMLAGTILVRQWWASFHPLPSTGPVPDGAIIAVIVPAHDEAPTIGSVVSGVRRAAIKHGGHETVVVVVDDGSADGSGAIARAAGADLVIRHDDRRGLGAALRTGLLAARHLGAGAAVYLDGDGEYDPRDIPAAAGPVLRGEADYVLGSRFPAAAQVMRPSRHTGNRVFTVLVSFLTGRRIADAQTGYRAFSARALDRAEIIHDYNYAQVLTLDLLRKNLRLAQVPVSYRVRKQGRSFIRYREYALRVLPAMIREILAP